MKLLKTKAVSVSTSAVKAVAVADVQGGTSSLLIQADPGNSDPVFIVDVASTPKDDGLFLVPGASVVLDGVGDGSTVYLIADAGTQAVRVAQIGL